MDAGLFRGGGADEIMITPLILICALSIARADCTPDTAEVVVLGPEVATVWQCQLYGQAYIATGPIADHLDGSTYLKVVCDEPGRPA